MEECVQRPESGHVDTGLLRSGGRESSHGPPFGSQPVLLRHVSKSPYFTEPELRVPKYVSWRRFGQQLIVGHWLKTALSCCFRGFHSDVVADIEAPTSLPLFNRTRTAPWWMCCLVLRVYRKPAIPAFTGWMCHRPMHRADWLPTLHEIYC